MNKFRLSGYRPETGRRVFGVDPHFDGVPGEGRLGKGQGQANRYPQLLPHQVNAGDHLRHRVFHLNPGVHFDKIKVSCRIHHKFHGAGAFVAAGFGCRHGSRPHLLPQLGGQGFGGGFFQKLLVLPLDGAVPFPQVNHMAKTVGHDLKFNMPGVKDQFLQVHFPVAEAGLRLGLGGGEGRSQFFRAVDPAHPPAAAAGAGLDQHRVADGLGHYRRLGGVFHRPVGAGHHRHPNLLHQGPGGGLVAHLVEHRRGGSDERQAALFAQLGKFPVLRQKAVAGMNRLAAALHGGGQDGGLIQIALGRLGRADAHRLGGQLHMQGGLVRLGVHRHSFNVQFPAGPDDAHRDFPPVGNQNPFKHSFTSSGRQTARPHSPPRRRLPPGSAQSRSRRGPGLR